MSDRTESLVEVVVGDLQITVGQEPPSMLGIYRRHAELVEDFPPDGHDTDDGYFFVAVGDMSDWPRLVVTQHHSPAGPGFRPGVLVVPRRRQLFIGAGTRLLAYHARSGAWQRSWEDTAEVGFWQWRRHGDVVVMSAELELAAWSTTGTKLWTTFVEPPWSYRVAAGQVTLDVMGTARTFDLTKGPVTGGL